MGSISKVTPISSTSMGQSRPSRKSFRVPASGSRSPAAARRVSSRRNRSSRSESTAQNQTADTSGVGRFVLCGGSAAAEAGRESGNCDRPRVFKRSMSSGLTRGWYRFAKKTEFKSEASDSIRNGRLERRSRSRIYFSSAASSALPSSSPCCASGSKNSPAAAIASAAASRSS